MGRLAPPEENRPVDARMRAAPVRMKAAATADFCLCTPLLVVSERRASTSADRPATAASPYTK
jgi:hypothetical protein